MLLILDLIIDLIEEERRKETGSQLKWKVIKWKVTLDPGNDPAPRELWFCGVASGFAWMSLKLGYSATSGGSRDHFQVTLSYFRDGVRPDCLVFCFDLRR